jgi:ABC-type uncharacterized transport system substrate-binding protein
VDRYREKDMKKKITVLALCALLCALSVSAQAQQPKKVPRIGYLAPGSRSSVSVEAFQQGLRDLGYIKGQNVVIEYRYAEGMADRVPNLAAELVQRKIDVIVVSGTPATQAVKNATKTIPIVMVSVTDPVGTGLVASLAHPGGNVTGLSNLYENLGGKQLELLKEAFPKTSRVAVLWDPANASNALWLGQLKVASSALRVTLQPVEVHVPDDLDPAFAAIKREGAGAFCALANTLVGTYGARIIDFAAKSRLPAMYPESRFTNAGGLMSYGANFADLYRRAATYVDKILKGAKPADLPVEQPTKFELVINLKTAKQIGVTIPQSVLYKADKVIK